MYTLRIFLIRSIQIHDHVHVHVSLQQMSHIIYCNDESTTVNPSKKDNSEIRTL